MQLFFESYQSKIYLVQSYTLPTHEEVDEMISLLQKYKGDNTVEYIRHYNDAVFSAPTPKKESNDKPIKAKKEGYIYLIKSEEYCKIGRAKSFKDRLITYRTENPKEIEVLIQIKVDDCVGIESELLDKYKHKNHRGEWFLLDGQDINDIKKFLNEKTDSILS